MVWLLVVPYLQNLLLLSGWILRRNWTSCLSILGLVSRRLLRISSWKIPLASIHVWVLRHQSRAFVVVLYKYRGLGNVSFLATLYFY